MKVRELYDILSGAAREVYDGREAAAAVDFLMERLFGVSRVEMVCGPGRDVAAEGVSGVVDDLLAGRPVQYIAGEAWFDGMWMKVCEGVLIPRPETEELVRWVAADGLRGEILDVGTGSGAIAIALARRANGVGYITALDVSACALEVARENARRAGVDVEFVQCDILREAPARRFDIVVSNPPYIPASERAAMHRNVVGFEPAEALFVPDDDPLVFYRAIARMRPGRLYFEIYEHLGREVCAMLGDMGYEDVELRRDINGRERMVKAVW